MTVEELVQQYILLRDRKAQMKAAYELKVGALTSVMDKVEARLLALFEEIGVDSMKTAAGTAYRSTRVSTTIADWDTFLQHVQRHGAWELLERRCSKTAVEQYKAANEDLPPGVNWSEERVVNIRRS